MRLFILICSLSIVSACATSQSGYKPIGNTYQARPAEHAIEIFTDGALPDREYSKIAVLDVHLESTGLMPHSLNSAAKKLKKQARAAGGDAIIDIKETKSRYLETTMYHVTAQAIRYAD